MAKLPKHLKAMDAETVVKLKTGFNRFRFGFADVGESMLGNGNGDGHSDIKFTFIGDFGRLKDAIAAEKASDDSGKPARLNPYLNGKRKVGWAVWYTERVHNTAKAAV